MTLSTNPSISIVIPAHNEGLWVRKTVEAVLEHSSGHSIEIVLVNDGSNDGSFSFLYENPCGNNKVRLIEGNGLGVSRARNLGAARAKGGVLVFLDAHVLPDPGWLDELVTLLDNPSVGLAGLAVRSVDDPLSVGYTYTFVDENLSPGWAPRSNDGPYETPCISGCCIGIRKGLFNDIGGFDSGHVHWGLEEIELSLRTWYMGYQCLVSPRVQIAHYFKNNTNRNFSVSYEDYDINLLRCVLTYFSGPRADTILKAVRQRENFPRSWNRVTEDAEFWKRLDKLRGRFRNDEEWYFNKFAEELKLFEQRLQELRTRGGSSMARDIRRIICPRCGATNIGVLIHCLMCKSPLTASGHSGSKFCTKCGNRLEPGKKFCTKCGHNALHS